VKASLTHPVDHLFKQQLLVRITPVAAAEAV
jgi:hypothetical protein